MTHLYNNRVECKISWMGETHFRVSEFVVAAVQLVGFKLQFT